MDKIYGCIDLKSFFASVECVERGLDPFKTDLAVTDASRGRGAITLAITPAMKEKGVKNRCRVFEIPENIKYISALPRMKLYMKYSADIYGVYLKYVSAEDIHVYSIDEVFIDFTPYLKTYKMTPKQFALRLMEDVFRTTGICATTGVGTNLFLAKVALDITAKHVPDHIGILNEDIFRRTIWFHEPITDIWNIGRGTAERLKKYRIKNLYQVAKCDPDILYREFGVKAEYLIDHANGYEPCTIADIKSYTAQSNSISNGQILFEDYSYSDAMLVMKEMVDLLVLELIEKGMVTDSIALSVGYSKDNEKSTGGTRRLDGYTSSYDKISAAFTELYTLTTHKNGLIRRINIGLEHITDEQLVTYQLDLFSDTAADEKERKKQAAVLAIRQKYGKNAILRGMSYQPKATAIARNKLVGGHNSE
ncbi:MAG: DNA repair protein [Oscillospiraceae bacterium]|nr:DNA repair protein [Oscillospiraceae bacterium]